MAAAGRVGSGVEHATQRTPDPLYRFLFVLGFDKGGDFAGFG
jgi:hypothetical protein